MAVIIKQKKFKLLFALAIVFFVLTCSNFSSFASDDDPEGDIFISTTSTDKNADDVSSN